MCGTWQGVSGSGKTTLGRALAEALSWPFIDADDLHPQANIDKMSKGEPLTDAARVPWLVNVRKAAVEAVENKVHGEMSGVLVACSALKASYREVLRGEHADLGMHINNLRDGACYGKVVTANGEKGDTRLRMMGEKGEGEQADKVTPAWTARPPRAYFVHPFGLQSTLFERITNRKSHFMKANMLASQLDALENPASEEGVVEIRLDASLDEQIRLAIEGLRAVGAIPAGY
jgi:gluconokinase